MGSARRDTTCVAAASNGLSGQSDRRTLQPSRKHRHRLHAVPRSVRSPRNRFYRFAAVGAQSRGCSETVSREAVAHSSAMPTSSRPSYGYEAAVRRSQSSWPAREDSYRSAGSSRFPRGQRRSGCPRRLEAFGSECHSHEAGLRPGHCERSTPNATEWAVSTTTTWCCLSIPVRRSRRNADSAPWDPSMLNCPP